MDIRIVLTAVLTVLPFVVLLRYYYRRDVFREPRGALVRTFLLGFLVTLPAIPIEIGLGLIPLGSAGSLGVALYSAFVVAAIPEESLKLLVIVRYCARRQDFDERMDGIVYGATAALGLAALENVLYVAGGGLITAALRSVASVPMHATWGAILGYHVARARLGGNRLDTWKGWAIATAAHGLFDFGLMGSALLSDEGAGSPGIGLTMRGLVLLSVAVAVASWLFVWKLIRRLRKEQRASQARERASAETAASEAASMDREEPADARLPAGSQASAQKVSSLSEGASATIQPSPGPTQSAQEASDTESPPKPGS